MLPVFFSFLWDLTRPPVLMVCLSENRPFCGYGSHFDFYRFERHYGMLGVGGGGGWGEWFAPRPILKTAMGL